MCITSRLSLSAVTAKIRKLAPLLKGETLYLTAASFYREWGELHYLHVVWPCHDTFTVAPSRYR